MAAQEAGCSSLGEFSDRDAAEYKAWAEYSMQGPSQFRTQMLIAQLIQMVSGALGGKRIKVNDLLPYYDEMLGLNTPRALAAKRKRETAHHQSLVDEIIAKKVKNNG